MGRVTRVKRRLLRQVVEENVSLVEGRRWSSREPRVHRRLRAAVYAGAPLALLLLTYVAGRSAARGRSDADAPAPLDAAVTPSATLAAPAGVPVAADVRSFAVPEPIAREVLPLTVRRVVLDPGHGGDNEGTATRDGLLEKRLTLDIARRLRRLLEVAAFEVVMTRTQDLALSLAERGELANRRQGDIFVSIHVNWLGDPEARGVETFYLGPTDDPYVERLAASENTDGGLRLAEYRAALDRVYAGVRREESRALAEAVQRTLLASARRRAPGVRDRGVKSAPFGVLIHTQMPAILAEVGAMSSDVDSELLRDPQYRQHLAEALFAGIRAYSKTLSDAAA
ncbi:MAG: N-acetylmuramoyl-L-alanine amidase family protein [Thermoanaerobaculia bacterium]